MNCDSEWEGGDRRRHRDARSAGLMTGVGQTDTLRPRSDAVDTWESKRGKGEARAQSDVIYELARTRGDRAAHPESSIRGKILRSAFVGSCSSSTAPTAMPFPAVSDRASGEQHSTRQPTSRCKSARLSLCMNRPSEEQDSTRQVRFGARNIAHQCSEEEPLAETENHRH